jgi:multisubunit Na+/H+ antiporter MnhG subunit
MKPSATNKWLLASVMGVMWAIATTILWTLLTLAFGRSKSDLRLITVLILGAVIAALLGAHVYSEGWKRGSKATVSPRKDSNP